MKALVVGPVSVVWTSWDDAFDSYSFGIYQGNTDCDNIAVNHVMTAMGYVWTGVAAESY